MLGLARLVATWACSQTGLRALSDDDYARITIAERFAEHARLDPSGTSWLPFPFWATGTVMKLLGPSLEVARVASAALAIGATWLVFLAARMWGMSDRRAFAAALSSTLIPSAAVLGSVATPELPTAALCAFGVVAVSAAPSGSEADPSRRDRVGPWVAGLAMLAATLSRYEAWPVAAVVACLGFMRRDWAARDRALSGVLSLAGPVGWVLHNRLAHGDALSFLHRVASYRAALDAGSRAGSTQTGRGLAYVAALALGAPEVTLAVVGLVLFAWFQRGDRAVARKRVARLRPWGWCCASLVAFLVIGEALGGAPTHHPERTVLAIWLLGVLAIVELVAIQRPPAWFALPVLVLLALDYRATLADRGVDRSAEEAAGVQLRSLVPKGERVIVATPDYGYFAVIAAFGRPSDAVIDESHDPRAKSETSIVATHWFAPERLRAEKATWLVAPSTVIFPLALRERSRNSQLAIYGLDDPK